jgi:two-component sensor histidine kinase/HPt (histidine-containing phosphotransfer) domain-containing protein
MHAYLDDVLPDQLPPFDLKEALARINGKTKLLRKMLVSFHKQYADAASALRAHLAEGRQEEAERLAHSLKSIAASLGALEVFKSAAIVEEALRGGQTQGLTALVALLEKALYPAVAAAGSLVEISIVSPEFTIGDVYSADPRPCILVVDDEPLNIDLVREVFAGDYRVLFSCEGAAALEMAASKKPDLILLDVMMPEMDGYQVCKLLKSNRQTREIPIVFLTGRNDEKAELKGLEMGAVDYVLKPINASMLKARVSNLVELKWAQSQLLKLAAQKHMERVAELLERSTEKEALNKKILQALADKEVLLKEVHHRVKNNLQVICSMLGMQALALQDAAAVSALNDSQSRVRSMAIIHELLYGSDTLSDLDFFEYAGQLLREMALTYGVNSSRVRLRANTTPQRIDLNRAIPCGLILNELISNAFKYAFPEGREGEVEVSLLPCESGLRLTVEDNGIGLPEGFEIGETRSLGLRIVQILVKQLGGQLRIVSDHGTRFEITFPVAHDGATQTRA